MAALRKPRVGVVLTVTAALLVTSLASAAEPDATLHAERLFNEGQQLFDEGKFDEACTKLQESLAVDWAIGTILNLARCHAAQGKTATAWREYTEGAKAAAKAGNTERAQGAMAIVQELEQKLSRLTILAPDAPRGLVITVAERRLELRLLGRAEPIDPGTYRITAEAPDHAPWSKPIEVLPNRDDVRITIPALTSLSPTTPDTPSEDTTGTSAGVGTTGIAGFVIGGVGVAVLVVGAVLGGITLSETKDAENDPTLCPNKVCSPEGRKKIDSAETKGITSTALFAVGGAALVVGAVLIGVDVAGADDDVAVLPLLGPGSAGVTLGKRF